MTPEQVQQLINQFGYGVFAQMQQSGYATQQWAQYLAQMLPPSFPGTVPPPTQPSQPMVGLMIEHNPAADAARTRALRGRPV